MEFYLIIIQISLKQSVKQMKRTRETINYAHPAERWNISGVNTLDGEDNDEEARRRRNQETQKQWLL